MADALREAWIWLLLAFILGLVVGYFLRKWTMRESSNSSSASRISELEAELGECRKEGSGRDTSAPVAATKHTAAAAAAVPVKKAAAAPVASLNLSDAKAVLGRSVKLDDLTVVEGIGPKISGLFTADGISTWRALASADTSRLQRILDDAGSQFNVHDPKTWPTQAGLLADGKWEEFKKLTDSLKGGR